MFKKLYCKHGEWYYHDDLCYCNKCEDDRAQEGHANRAAALKNRRKQNKSIYRRR